MPAPYKASQNPDGTFDILGVPIFGEVPKGQKGNENRVGRPWLEAALENLKARAEEGYLPPVHLNHHGMDKTIRAGHFLGSHVEEITYDGKAMAALFVDLVKIPAEHFRQIQAGEYPYRSVEIFDYAKKVINTLALLDDDEPFFRFELLNGDTISLTGEVVESFGASLDMESLEATRWGGRDQGGIGLITSRTGAVALFQFKEASTMRKQFVLNLEGDKPCLFDEENRPVEFVLGSGIELFQEDDDKKEPKPFTEDEIDKVEAQLAKLQAKLKKMKANRAKAKAKEDPEEEAKATKARAAEEQKPAEPPGKKVVRATALEEDAEIQGRLTALEATNRKRDESDEAEARSTKAVAALKRDGYHVDERTQKDFHAFAARGQEALDEFDASFRRHAHPDGRKTLEDYESARPPEAQEFHGQGADALEKATEFAAQFDELKAGGYHPGSEKKDFIRRRMIDAGFKAAG